jgi:hypothetical protein
MIESLLHGIASGLAGEETGSNLLCRSRASELMADSCHNQPFRQLEGVGVSDPTPPLLPGTGDGR